MIHSGIEWQGLGRIGRLCSRELIVRQSESSCRRTIGFDVQFGVENRRVGVHCLLMNVKVVNSKRVPRLESNRLPNAFGHVTRTPIPAVVVWGFAGVGSGRDVLFIAVIMG